MRLGTPKNVRVVGERLFAFEIEGDGKTVYAEITCEAALNKSSDEIESEDVKRAIKIIELDSHRAFSHAVRKLYRSGENGDTGLPVFISSLDI